ncbi:MAG: CopG family antitoxin [Desulfococcaceae bacterium]
MEKNNKVSSISKADSLEKIGEFWDTHDFADFDTDCPDVTFDISCAVPVETDLFSEIEKQAKHRGVKVETLVNLWLQQKLAEHTQLAQSC